MRIWISLAAASLLQLMAITGAQAGLLEPHLNLKTFPQCHDEKVVKRIIRRFNWAEKHTWQRGFGLDQVTNIRESSLNEYGISPIPRRYCRGHAHLSNGRHPTVFFLIEGGQGFAGNGFRVEYCVNGLDPWREFDGSCRVLRH